MTTREQAATDLRQKISGTDPVLLSVIDGLKNVFGGRLRYVQLADGTEIGNRKEFESEGICPAPPPDLRNKGESPSAYLKRLEDEHLEAHAKQAGAGAHKSAGRAKRSRVG